MKNVVSLRNLLWGTLFAVYIEAKLLLVAMNDKKIRTETEAL